MKRRLTIRLFLPLIIIFAFMLLVPSYLFATPSQFIDNGHYYEVVVVENGGGTWTEANTLAQSSTFNDGSNTYAGHLVTITSSAESTFVLSLYPNESSYWIGAYQTLGSIALDEGWNWVNNDTWDMVFAGLNWASGEPNDSNGDENDEENYAFMDFVGKWIDLGNRTFFTDGYIVEYDKLLPKSGISQSVDSSQIVEPAWVRTHEMTCFQVWINEDNNFEFVFWWEYYNNNWVKIYDMAGNEVFSIDMPKGEAHFEADLPDGFYTVKTFHDDYENPIQEFIIGK